jgi:hypothetical protein
VVLVGTVCAEAAPIFCVVTEGIVLSRPIVSTGHSTYTFSISS